MSGESDDSDDDSDGDLSDDYSEAEEVIRTRLSQSVVEESAAAKDVRLVLFAFSVSSIHRSFDVVLHVSFYLF